MLVFSVSDKGGTGRSVTSTNLAYRAALQGFDTVYLDFDFGSPTVGAIFEVEYASLGVRSNGLHEYLLGDAREPRRIDVWEETNRERLKRPIGARRLVLLPGTFGGSEFLHLDDEMVGRCADLFQRMQEEFEFCIVDLSAGRSAAMDLVLRATASGRAGEIPARWLVFHRWTRQHVLAASHLVYGESGLIKYGVDCGFDPHRLQEMISFVRTAVIDPDGDSARILSAAQKAWLVQTDDELELLASSGRLGRDLCVGSVPLDPVLQWREQLITDGDVKSTGAANAATVKALQSLTDRLCESIRAQRETR
jgi:hypothetical protein